jgi:hypothetical protein
MASVQKISPLLMFNGPAEKMKKIVVADLDCAAAA